MLGFVLNDPVSLVEFLGLVSRDTWIEANKDKLGWEGSETELRNRLDMHLNRGCIGLVAIRLGLGNEKDTRDPPTKHCWRDLGDAVLFRRKYTKTCGCGPDGTRLTAKIFSVHYYDDGMGVKEHAGGRIELDLDALKTHANAEGRRFGFDLGWVLAYTNVSAGLQIEVASSDGASVSQVDYATWRADAPEDGELYNAEVWCVACERGLLTHNPGFTWREKHGFLDHVH